MAVFDCITSEFVCPLCSRFECPAGLGSCSHLRGEYASLCVIKDLVEVFSKEEVMRMFPPLLSTMKGLPIPWDYAFTDAEVPS